MNVRFLNPVDGDILSDKAGEITSGGALMVTVTVSAPAGRAVTVAGMPAFPCGEGTYRAAVPLKSGQNRLAAEADGERDEIDVYRRPNATSRYRLSLDDNIWWLQDIARRQNEYRSLFDNPYLGFLREAHERYGTRVHCNLYYECPEFGGFCLTDMPDRYKSEWRANADWLHLSFHAKADLPDRPYLTADYETVRGDAEAVTREIVRFAGDEVLPSETTLHWGAVTRDGVRALHDAGARTLAGYLCLDKKGEPLVSYYLSADEIRHIDRYGMWYDRREDVTFSKIDVVLNEGTREGNLEKLETAYATHPEKGFWEFLMHEEYFYPFYRAYLPDFKERVTAALAWAERKGLTPSFLTETEA